MTARWWAGVAGSGRSYRCFRRIADDPQALLTGAPTPIQLNAEGTLAARRGITVTPPAEIYDWPGGTYLQDAAGTYVHRGEDSLTMGHGDVGYIYGNGSAAPEIIAFDVSAAFITELVPSGHTTNFPAAGLAFSFYDDQLYAYSSGYLIGSSAAGSALFRVNPTTGAITELVTFDSDPTIAFRGIAKPICTLDGGVWMLVTSPGGVGILRWDIPTSTYDIFLGPDLPDANASPRHGPDPGTVWYGTHADQNIYVVDASGNFSTHPCPVLVPGVNLQSTIDASGNVVLTSTATFGDLPSGFYRWC